LTGGFLSGLGTAFGTGLPHRLAKGAVLQDVTALHVELTSSKPSVSTHIAALRNLFFKPPEGQLGTQIQKILKVSEAVNLSICGSTRPFVNQGELPLVVRVHSADTMATLIELKKEIEAEHKAKVQLSFSGASEAHLLAKEIGEAGIGVILNPARPFPTTWKERRM